MSCIPYNQQNGTQEQQKGLTFCRYLKLNCKKKHQCKICIASTKSQVVTTLKFCTDYEKDIVKVAHEVTSILSSHLY